MTIEDLPALDCEEQEAMSRAVTLMIQDCPFMDGIEAIYEDAGLNAVGIFPMAGTVYLKRYVSGMFVGRYNFYLLYRVRPADDETKIAEENRLDALAAFLEGKPVAFGGEPYQLQGRPVLTDGRKITSIQRVNNAYLLGILEDGSMDFRVDIQIEYTKKGTT